MQEKGIKPRPFVHTLLIGYSSTKLSSDTVLQLSHRIRFYNSLHRHLTMLPAHFFTSGLLNLGILLQGLARRVFRFRKLPIVRLKPSLSSPPPIHLLEAPIAPLERLVEEFRTPSSSGGLIVTEGPPLVQPSPIPTRSFQSSLVTVTPNRIPNLVPFLLLLIFISGFLLLLPGLVYVRASIANRISAICRRQSRKFSKASSFKPVSSLVLVFSLVPNFFSTLIFSRHLVSLVSLLLLWTGPVRSILPAVLLC